MKKKELRKTLLEEFFTSFILNENCKKNVVMAHTNKNTNTAQNRRDKGIHLDFVIRPDWWQFFTLW